MISLPDHCDECGFDALAHGGPAASAGIRALGAAFRMRLTSGNSRVGARPDPKTWSPLEYGAHVRDVIAIWTWAVKQALTDDRPQYPAPDPDIADRAAADGGYGALDPAAVGDELLANADRAARKFDEVRGSDWTRVIVIGDEDITVLDIANKLLHEGHHHLQDIDRQGVL